MALASMTSSVAFTHCVKPTWRLRHQHGCEPTSQRAPKRHHAMSQDAHMSPQECCYSPWPIRSHTRRAYVSLDRRKNADEYVGPQRETRALLKLRTRFAA